MDFETIFSFFWLANFAICRALDLYLGMPPMAHPYLHGLADGAFAVLCLQCVSEYLNARRHRRRRFHS